MPGWAPRLESMVWGALSRECPMALRATKGDENGISAEVGYEAAGNGRGRVRSGAVEAVRESDPERVY